MIIKNMCAMVGCFNVYFNLHEYTVFTRTVVCHVRKGFFFPPDLLWHKASEFSTIPRYCKFDTFKSSTLTLNVTGNSDVYMWDIYERDINFWSVSSQYIWIYKKKVVHRAHISLIWAVNSIKSNRYRLLLLPVWGDGKIQVQMLLIQWRNVLGYKQNICWHS